MTLHTRPFNGYDALKLLAMGLMLLDHLAAYLLPEQMWMRALGRGAFPLFLFLVGYSGKRGADFQLLAHALVVMALLWAGTGDGLPVNVLFAILLARIMISQMDGWLQRRPRELFIALAVWAPLVELVVEYGMIAIMMALLGQQLKEGKRDWVAWVASYVTLAFTGGVMFLDHPPLLLLALVSLGASFALCWRFYPCVICFGGGGVERSAAWLARRSLWFYTLHLALLMLLKLVA